MTTIPQTSSQTSPLAPLVPMLWHQLRAEIIRMWRTPSFFIATLVLPSLLYTITGLNKQSGLEGGIDIHAYTLASIATYGAVSVILYSFGTGIANERAQRVNVLMRTTPLPASIYLLAKVITAFLSILATLLVLSGLAFLVGGVQLSGIQWITLIASLTLGALPFVGLAFAIGNIVNPTAAGPVINLSFFVFAFASGIFAPLSQLPDFLQTIAPYLPLYRLGQLGWSAVGVHITDLGTALLLLALYALVFFTLAIFVYRVEERRTFG